MGKWQDIATIPLDRPVMVFSATGIECLARASQGGGWRVGGRYQHAGQRRVRCTRLDGRSIGDIMAVKWREPTPAELAGIIDPRQLKMAI